MLIGLSGYAQTGKDTVGGLLVAAHEFRRVAFADKLRKVALDVNPLIPVWEDGYTPTTARLSEVIDEIGWDNAKTDNPEVRRLLQALGVAIRDRVDGDAWVKAALANVCTSDNIVITDVRFPNEAEAIKLRDGVVVRVHRPGVDAVNGHVSEHALDDYPFDAHLRNDGDIEDLEAQIAVLLARYRVDA